MNCILPKRRKLAATVALTAVSSPLLIAAIQEVKARMGTHGMVLFGGTDGIYASHMPMFHAPHDVQAVMRLRIADNAIEQSLKQKLAAAPALWSIEPEKFDLNRLRSDHQEPLTAFDAKIYEGHFERGGKARFERVRFQVESTLLFNQLDATKRSAASRKFLWLGKGREQFLIKHLDQRPDVDLIGYFTNDVPLTTQRTITLDPAVINSTALAAPDNAAMLNTLRSAGAAPQGKVTWMYVETADLV